MILDSELALNNFMSILEKAKLEIASVENLHELELIKSKYIGKSGEISLLMRNLKTIPETDRKKFGEVVNLLKTEFEKFFNSHKVLLLEKEIMLKQENEIIDVTIPGRGSQVGSLHPVTISLNNMVNIFQNLGFNVVDGPEIENDYYNFLALNFPLNHPARAMQDTFYTQHNYILRTHTSPVQIRYSELNTPPIKIISPGRVYRNDMDKTHSPMFHQLEGLWIEKGINFANLKAIIISFLRTFFNKDDLKVRFRTSFFPFTEPSAEVDIMDKNGQWLEVAGCGMVHPNVLNNMNIDSNEYSGFAFGIGIDRFTMLKYEITDLRLFFENDLDFLRQFVGSI